MKSAQWLIVLDKRDKLFQITGPIVDDTVCVNRVFILNQERGEGEELQISTTPATTNKTEIRKDFEKKGYTHTNDSLI